MLSLDRPCVMGVLNVTPDSFSDGGKFVSHETALRQAAAMVAEGASIIDVGGESTRPGANAVSEQEELDRTIPVIEALCAEHDVAISIDTSKPQVMRDAVAAGAALINDVNALQAEGALQAAVAARVPVCLMHMRGDPRSMQNDPRYDDVVAEVTQFLADRVAQCVTAGLDKQLLLIDPGFGFGKTVAQNVALLANLRQLQVVGCPILVGLSRKSTLGAITGRDVDDRMAASVAAAVVAVLHGATIVRAHDVRETVDAVNVAVQTLQASKQE